MSKALTSYFKSRYQPGSSYDLSKDKEYASYQAERDKQRKIAQFEAAAAQADAEAAKNNNMSTLGQIKTYGPTVAKQNTIGLAKSVGEGLAQLPKDIYNKTKQNVQIFTNPKADRNPEALLQAQEKAQSLPTDLKNKAKNIGVSDGQQLLKMVSEGRSTKEIDAFLTEAKKRKASADKQIAGASLSAASLGVGGGSVAKAASQGTKALAGNLLATGVSGAAGNVGSTLMATPDASASELAKSGLAGAGGGLLLGGVGAVAGEAFRKLKPLQGTLSHVTNADNALSILNDGKIKQTQAPIKGFEGKRGVSLGVSDWARNFSYPDQNNVEFVFDKNYLRKLGNVKGTAEEFSVKSDIPVSPNSVAEVKVGTPELAQQFQSKGFNAVVDPELNLQQNRLQIGAGSIIPESRQLKAGTVTDPRYLQPETRNARMTAGNNPGVLAKDIVPNVSQSSKYIRQLSQIDDAIQEAQLNGGMSAEEARSLIRKRKELVSFIENPETQPKEISTPVTKEIYNLDKNISIARESGNTAKADLLEKQRSYLAETSVPRTGKAPMAAKRTEALALEQKLTDGYDIKETPVMSMRDQAEKATALINSDPETAKKIAMGLETPPGDLQASHVYTAVANKAAKEGDAQLLRQLAEESTIPGTGKAYGQYNAAFAVKDPESPLVAMEKVIDARKKTAALAIDGKKISIPVSISETESKQITEMAKLVSDAKEKALAGGDAKSYGRARVAFDNYVNDLVSSSGPSLRQAMKQPGFTSKAVGNTAGFLKSMKATLDNSALGRQGRNIMWNHPDVWLKNSKESFVNIFKTLKKKGAGAAIVDEVNADAVSRTNALNGRYKAMGLDVYGTKKLFMEEAFPVSFRKLTDSKAGEVALRPFEASEVAYSVFQQRNRLDAADFYLTLAEKQGQDINDPAILKSIGRMVNDLTGRGSLGKYERAGAELNKIFFSPKLLVSHFNNLTNPITGAGGSSFVRKRAALNLVRSSVGTALALNAAAMLTGGKVDWDPRSSNFGKLQVGNTRVDLTGGQGSLLTIGARVLPSMNNGHIGWYTKSSSSGEVNQLNKGGYADATIEDAIMNFIGNKYSPAVGTIRDLARGKDFSGKKPTVQSVVKNLTLPLVINNFNELKKDPKAINVVAGMILDGLGLSTNTYGMSGGWNADNSVRVDKFAKAVGNDKFNQANDEFKKEFEDWYNKISAKDSSFWSLPQETRSGLVTSQKNKLTEAIFDKYGFKYEKEKKSDKEKSILDNLKKQGLTK